LAHLVRTLAAGGVVPSPKASRTLLRGLSEIGARIHLDAGTVKDHVSAILQVRLWDMSDLHESAVTAELGTPFPWYEQAAGSGSLSVHIGPRLPCGGLVPVRRDRPNPTDDR
jgi:hypothetical protein